MSSTGVLRLKSSRMTGSGMKMFVIGGCPHWGPGTRAHGRRATLSPSRAPKPATRRPRPPGKYERPAVAADADRQNDQRPRRESQEDQDWDIHPYLPSAIANGILSRPRRSPHAAFFVDRPRRASTTGPSLRRRARNRR